MAVHVMRRLILNLFTLASALLFFVALLWPALAVWTVTGPPGVAPFQKQQGLFFDWRSYPDASGTVVGYFPSALLCFLVMGVAAVLPTLWCIKLIARANGTEEVRGFNVVQQQDDA